MTTNELRDRFNNSFGLYKWPTTFEVDHETYANVCHDLFVHIKENNSTARIGSITRIEISIGPNHGIFFKNVELILK